MTVILSSAFTACTDTSDNPVSPTPQPPAELAEYAVLFYGHGSMSPSLDFDILKNIYDCYTAEAASYDKVKVAVQYKWGKKGSLHKRLAIEHLMTDEGPLTQEEQDYINKFGSNTVRFVVDPTKKGRDLGEDDICLGPQQMLETPIYGQSGFDASLPDSLISFINWAVEACPAKHYMLIIGSHGNGFRPDQDSNFRYESDDDDAAFTRALLPDCNSKEDMSILELHAALKASKARMDVVYFDACLMNMVEVEYELRNVTDYIIASTFPVPGIGGSYSVLIDELAKNQSVETALSNFCKANGQRWTSADEEIETESNFDQSVIRTSALDDYAAKVKDFTTRLVDAYTNGGDEVRQKIDKWTANAIKVDGVDPFYELHTYLAMLATMLPEYFPNGNFEELQQAYKACLVHRFSSPNLEKYGFQIGVSTMLAHEGTYELYKWARSGNGLWTLREVREEKPDISIYQQLEWDRATGWSRWLLLNKQKPEPFFFLDTEHKEGDVINYDLPKE